MNRRIEQRFQVYSPARVILLDDPKRELVCFLVDISAAGVRLLAEESLPCDGMIVLEAEDHLVLCDVRNSYPRGSRFVIGAEKVHILAKIELPPGIGVEEKIQALVDDFHLRLRTQLAIAPPEQFCAELPAVEESNFEAVVDECAMEIAPLITPKLELLSTEAFAWIPPEPAPTLPGRLRPALGHFATTLRPPMRLDIHRIQELVELNLQASLTQEEPQVPAQQQLPPALVETAAPVERPVAPALGQFAPLQKPTIKLDIPRIQEQVEVMAQPWPLQAGSQTTLCLPVVAPIDEPKQDVLVEVGGPARMPGQRRILRTWSIVIGVLATVLILGTEYLFYGPYRVNAQMVPAIVPVDPKGSEISPGAAVATPVVFTAPPQSPELRRATVSTTANTWITACADGKMVLSKLLVPNETHQIDFVRVAMLRFGNAGGVQLALDGKPLQQIGEPGMVRVVELTPEGFGFLPVQTSATTCQTSYGPITR